MGKVWIKSVYILISKNKLLYYKNMDEENTHKSTCFIINNNNNIKR